MVTKTMFSNHPFGEPMYKRKIANNEETTLRNTMQSDTIYYRHNKFNSPNTKLALVDPSHTFFEM